MRSLWATNCVGSTDVTGTAEAMLVPRMLSGLPSPALLISLLLSHSRETLSIDHSLHHLCRRAGTEVRACAHRAGRNLISLRPSFQRDDIRVRDRPSTTPTPQTPLSTPTAAAGGTTANSLFVYTPKSRPRPLAVALEARGAGSTRSRSS